MSVLPHNVVLKILQMSGTRGAFGVNTRTRSNMVLKFKNLNATNQKRFGGATGNFTNLSNNNVEHRKAAAQYMFTKYHGRVPVFLIQFVHRTAPKRKWGGQLKNPRSVQSKR